MKVVDADGLKDFLKSIPVVDLSDGKGLCRVIFAEALEKAIKNIPEHYIIDVDDKQTPRNPTVSKIGGLPKCPNCHNSLDRETRHCDMCGQKLDWSEKE